MTFNEVKVGDLVILSPTYGQGTTIEKVARVTATQIVLECSKSRKYHKKSGREVGRNNGWSCQYIRIARDGEIAEIQDRQRHEQALYGVQSIAFSKLSTACLQEILALCKEVEE